MAKLRPTVGPTDAVAQARRALRSEAIASLATAARDQEAWPYASLVAVGLGQDGTPVLLLSTLSDHTRNLEADPRASLLFDLTAGLANRLAGERLTLMGRVDRLGDGERLDALRARFLRRHPGAQTYEGFGDFAYYEMAVTSAHLIGGFGQACWLDGADLVSPEAETAELAAAETEMLDHMNEDHGEAVQLYANVLARKPGRGWRLTGIDSFGIDLKAGGATARIGFDAPADSPGAVRAALIDLARRARAAGDADHA